jgi:branched-chain amino acid aminotransferase
MSKYLSYNGELILAKEFRISPDNRAFNYGDGIFETIRCLNSKPLFFAKHYQRLRNALYELQIDLPAQFSEEFFRINIHKLLQKNRIYKGARIRLNIFRSEGGLYTPMDNTAQYVMSVKALSDEEFVLNSEGITIDVFDKIRKPINSLAQFKTNNALLYVLAAKWKARMRIGDCIIKNQDGFLLEGVSSNIFCVIDKKIITPAIESGCVNGTMRATIFEIADRIKIPLVETLKLNEKVLLQADEIFFTNAIQGVVWTVSYKDRRYFHFVASKLLTELNKLVAKEIS